MLPESAHTHSLKILLAEDHLVNQKIALLMLQRLGYQADLAKNGLDALESLQRQPYDVVLLDVQMPELDGLAVARWICQHWQPHMRPYLIAMTANAMQGDRESCLNAGMDHYMSKPIHMKELAQVLSQCKPLDAAIAPLVCNALNSERLSPAATLNPNTSALDPTVLAAFREEMGETGNAVVAELVAYYLAEAPLLLQTIRTAISQHDFKNVQLVAHGLRASSASLGAICLSQRCRDLETMALNASVDQIIIVFARLASEYSRVAVALKHTQLQPPL